MIPSMIYLKAMINNILNMKMKSSAVNGVCTMNKIMTKWIKQFVYQITAKIESKGFREVTGRMWEV